MIAQKDLDLRGPGDLIGTRQSGEPGNRFLFADVRLLDEVAQCVQQITRNPSDKAMLDQIRNNAVQFFREKEYNVALN